MAAVTEQQIFDREDWWDKNGAFRLLHDINPLRLRWLQTATGGISGKTLLDIGCGGGIFAEAAALTGAKVTGIDKSAAAINCAKQHSAERKLSVNYYCQNSLTNNITTDEYDIITCFEMLEHTDSPDEIVADIAALLKPGGTAAFSTINKTLRAWALMILGLEMVVKVLPAGSHDYARFLPPTKLAAICKRTGLAITAATGLRYSLFGKTYLFDEQDMSVNYFLAATRQS